MLRPITISGFSGLAPRAGARALRPDQAQIALDARLTSGELEALNEPLQLVTLAGMPGPAQAAFKSVATAGTRWIAWHTPVDAVRALVAGDRSGLAYFTGNGIPQWTNYALAGQDGYPIATRVLGVPVPPAGPTVGFTGGSGAVVNRAVRYSLVLTSADGWDQESEASPATVGAGQAAGTWQISGLIAPPVNTYPITSSSWSSGILTVVTPSTFGLRVGDVVTHGVAGTLTVLSVPGGSFTAARASDPGALTGSFARSVPHDTGNTKWRIYWSESDGSFTSVGDYATSTSQPIAIPATTLGSSLSPLTDAPMPPVDLKSLVRHPSGALIGISGNQLCASEPYKPYAWPQRYRTPLAFDPVACRVFGRSVVVGTKGIPAIFTGADPSTFTPEDVNSQWPCLSARGMVATQAGVGYPSPYGLVWVSAGGAQLITQGSYAQRDWQNLNPETFAAAPFGAAYVAVHDGEMLPQLWLFQPLEVAVISAGSGGDVSGITSDPETGALILLRGNSVWEWDADPSARRTYVWRSKEFTLSPPGNVGAVWMIVDPSMTEDEVVAAAATRAAVIAANVALSATGSSGGLGYSFLGRYALGGSALYPVPPATFDQLALNVYVDGELTYSDSDVANVVSKLTALAKTDNVTFELIGNMRVRILAAHGSGEALREYSA